MDPTTIVNPCVPSERVLDEKEKVLRTVKGILNKLTPKKFEPLFQQLLTAGINTPEILQEVISLIFTKAADEPTLCSMYAALCGKLSRALPEFPPFKKAGGSGAGDVPISFRRVLLSACQSEFYDAARHRKQAGELPGSQQGASVKGEEGAVEGGEGKDGVGEGGMKGGRGKETDRKKDEEEGKREKGRGEEEKMIRLRGEQQHRAKARTLGIVRLIGELCLLGIITVRIILECMR
ncbi:unnamed protein product, partial [Closterium sp. Naga37s-1]